MPANIFRKRAPLTKRERRYCSCLLNVRDKSPINPYAICTSSVYTQQGVTRRKRVDCDSNYEYENVPVEMLRSLAKEKKVPIHSKVGNKKVMTPKKTLINRLYKHIYTRKSKYYHSLKNKASSKKEKEK
jgi:hypothetical protein